MLPCDCKGAEGTCGEPDVEGILWERVRFFEGHAYIYETRERTRKLYKQSIECLEWVWLELMGAVSVRSNLCYTQDKGYNCSSLGHHPPNVPLSVKALGPGICAMWLSVPMHNVSLELKYRLFKSNWSSVTWILPITWHHNDDLWKKASLALHLHSTQNKKTNR